MFYITKNDLGQALYPSKPLLQGTSIFKVLCQSSPIQTRHTLQVGADKHVLAPIVELINHSCDPNCGLIIDGDKETIEVMAIKNIAQDEELTIDYCTFERHIKFMQTCRCGSPLCRKTISGFKDLPESRKNELRPFIAPYLRT